MEKTEEEVVEEKTEARGEIEGSEQREEEGKAPLLTATRRVLQKGREELQLINVLMTERPKIRPLRTTLKRRIDEFLGQMKREKGMEQL